MMITGVFWRLQPLQSINSEDDPVLALAALTRHLSSQHSSLAHGVGLFIHSFMIVHIQFSDPYDAYLYQSYHITTPVVTPTLLFPTDTQPSYISTRHTAEQLFRSPAVSQLIHYSFRPFLIIIKSNPRPVLMSRVMLWITIIRGCFHQARLSRGQCQVQQTRGRGPGLETRY